MEWSEQDVLHFIDYYKKKKVLWDPKDLQYFNKNKKQDAWNEVGREVGFCVEEVKRKMECLQSSFRRERNKEKKSIGIGKGGYF